MEPLTLNPVTDPVVTPLMPKKPFPWATIIITTIAILSLTAAIYLFIQNRTLPRQLATPLSPSPTSSADPTADWQTYTNTTYNFMYPVDYQIQTTGEGISLIKDI